MRHVAHMDESFQLKDSRKETYSKGSYMEMSRVTHMNVPCHTYEGAMFQVSRKGMSNVTHEHIHVKELCHTHYEACHTRKWGMPHERVIPHT